MREYSNGFSVKLTDEEQASYERVLSYYKAVDPSRSKAFRLLLRALELEISRQSQKAYWSNTEFDPPRAEPSHDVTISSEEEFLEREAKDTWTE